MTEVTYTPPPPAPPAPPAVPAPHLFVAVPSINGWVWSGFADSLMLLFPALAQVGINATLYRREGDSLVTRARDMCVAEFLARPEMTHLLFLDCDLRFRAQDVIAMVRADLDVVAGAYPKKQDEPAFVWNPFTATDIPYKEGFVVAKDAGTGFLLVKRAVFDALRPHTKRVYWWNLPGVVRDDTGKAEGTKRALVQRNYFSEEFEPITDDFDAGADEVVWNRLSEDWAFCRKAQAAGLSVHVYADADLGHYGAKEYRGTLATYLAPEVAPEAAEPGTWDDEAPPEVVVPPSEPVAIGSPAAASLPAPAVVGG